MRKSGFTLIELLVAVLIIGILTSIAIPQYEKSVARARAAEVLMTTKSILDATSVYSATYRRCPTDLSELDITVAGVSATTNSIATGKDWKFTLTNVGGLAERNCAVDVTPRYSSDGTYVARRVLVKKTTAEEIPGGLASGDMYWVCQSGDCEEFFIDLGVVQLDNSEYYQ